MKKQSGITLIALVITIIVLLILAGVTIAAINSNESAPNKAVEARDANEVGAAKDAATLLVADKIQGYYEAKYVNRTSNAGTVLEYLKENNVLGGDGATTGEYTVVITDNTEDDTTGIITVTKGIKTMATGVVDVNGIITWNVTQTGDNGNQQQEEETIVSTNPVIFKYNVLNENQKNVEITSLNWDYIRSYAENKSTEEWLNDDEYGVYFAEDFLTDNNKLIIPSKVKLSKNENDEYYYDATNGQEYTVTKIGRSGFYIGGDCAEYYIANTIEEISLPNTVTNIDGAFCYLNSLEKINIPNSVTSIGQATFFYCGLTSINIPITVTSIEGEAFYGCSLKSITAPFGQAVIASDAFDNFYEVEEIHFTEGITSIGEYCLNCFGNSNFSLTNLEITVPSGVTIIGNNAFNGCYSLQTVNLPNSLTTIGNYAFSGCGIQEISLPNSITTIGEGSFSGCGLTSITIPSSVISIGYGAFDNCSSLETITIPNSITNLNYLGYMNETAVINLPSTITHIYYNAFYDGETVNYAGTRAQWNAIKLMDESGYEVSVDDGYELYTGNVIIHCLDD